MTARTPLVDGQSGQALTEYVLTSGLLVLIGIMLSSIVSPALRTFVRGVVSELRLLAP